MFLKKRQGLVSLGALVLMLLISATSEADIRERSRFDFHSLPDVLYPGCNHAMGSPNVNLQWRYMAPYAPPKNFGYGSNLTWEFVSVWFVHFNTMHERLKNLHVTDFEREWIKQRHKDLTTESGLLILDADAWMNTKLLANAEIESLQLHSPQSRNHAMGVESYRIW